VGHCPHTPHRNLIKPAEAYVVRLCHQPIDSLDCLKSLRCHAMPGDRERYTGYAMAQHAVSLFSLNDTQLYIGVLLLLWQLWRFKFGKGRIPRHRHRHQHRHPREEITRVRRVGEDPESILPTRLTCTIPLPGSSRGCRYQCRGMRP